MNWKVRAAIVFVLIAAMWQLAKWDVQAGAEQAWDALASIPSITLWAVIVLSCLNYALRAARWHAFITLPPRQVPVLDDVLVYLGGFAFTLTPGKLGEAYRSTYLVRHGIPFSTSMAALVTERMLDLVSMLFLAMGAIFLLREAWLTFGIVAVLVIACMAFLLHPGLMRAALNAVAQLVRLCRSRTVMGLIERLGAFLDAASEMFDPRRLGPFLILSIVAWGLEGVGLWLLAITYAPNLSVFLGIGIYAFAVLVGALTFLPGGLGGTELAMAALLVVVGLSASEAAAVTFVCRAATLWFAVAIGTLVLPWLTWRDAR